MPTKRDAPIRGTLVMGRFLNEGEIARLSKESRLQFAVARVGDPYLSPEFSQAQIALQTQRTLVTTGEGNGLLAYSPLNDLYGKPSLIMRVTIPRSTSQDGQGVIERFRKLIIVCVVVAAAILSLLLAKFCFLPVEAVERVAERNVPTPPEESELSEVEEDLAYGDEEASEAPEDPVEQTVADQEPDPAAELSGKGKAE